MMEKKRIERIEKNALGISRPPFFFDRKIIGIESGKNDENDLDVSSGCS